MKKVKIKKAEIVFLGFVIFSMVGCTVVRPGYKAMKWKPWGKGLVTDKIYEDGPVWHWPWVGVIDYNIRWQTFTEKVSVLTKDELHIDLTVSVTMRPILNEIPKLELEIGSDYYNSVVRPEFISTTRTIFAGHSYANVSPHSATIEIEILKSLLDKTKGKHLEFDNITIDHIVYPDMVSSAVNRKLAVEQDIEQKDYEIEIAKKNAEIQRILARGQKDAQTIIDSSITSKYLQYKSLEVQDKLSTSPNAKFYFIPLGKDGLPIIIDSGESNH